MTRHTIFVTGATGYLGRALIPVLVARGHCVRALARVSSAHRVPRGAEMVIGDALDPSTFAGSIPPADTLVHLVGTPHPSPAKAESFKAVDLVSVDAMLSAASSADIGHLIYVSVAQPAPVMQAYIAVRQSAEARIRASGIHATILRPWYVLGPGHRWPYVLLPFYAVLRMLPPTRESALRLGLVTLSHLGRAIGASVARPKDGFQWLEAASEAASENT